MLGGGAGADGSYYSHRHRHGHVHVSLSASLASNNKGSRQTNSLLSSTISSVHLVDEMYPIRRLFIVSHRRGEDRQTDRRIGGKTMATS